INVSAALTVTDGAGNALPPGECEVPVGGLSCNLGDLAPGSTTTLLVSAHTSPSAAPGSYDNNVTVSTPTPDPNAANDTGDAPFTLGPGSADVSITKDGDPSLAAGSDFTYTIKVTNNGLSDATGVVATDVLPAGLTATQAQTSLGTCAITGQTVTCNI